MGHPTRGGSLGKLSPGACLPDAGYHEQQYRERESAEVLLSEEVEQDFLVTHGRCHCGSTHLVHHPLHHHLQ